MKATAAEADARTEKVAELLVGGWGRADICSFARETWGISDSQTDRYVRRARHEIRTARRRSLADAVALADARYEMLFRLAVEKDDLRLAMSAVKEQAALARSSGGMADPQEYEDFMAALYTYAEILRAVLPPEQLARVWEATSGLVQVRDSIEDACYPIDEILEQRVHELGALGGGHGELPGADIFDGLVLPDDQPAQEAADTAPATAGEEPPTPA